MSEKIKRDSAAKEDLKPKPFKAYNLIDDYIAIDTGEYSNDGPMSGGSYAIVNNKNLPIDTIELDYGLNKLGDRLYFYQKLTRETNATFEESEHSLALYTDKYYLLTNNDKTDFSQLTTSFDDYFSSPSVIEKQIYFWQMEKLDSLGSYKVSAAKFNPTNGQTTTHFLLNDTLETDNSNHFWPPHLNNNQIIFIAEGNKKWKFSKDFKLE